MPKQQPEPVNSSAWETFGGEIAALDLAELERLTIEQEEEV